MNGPLAFTQPSIPDPLDAIKHALEAIQRHLAKIGDQHHAVAVPATPRVMVDDEGEIGALASAKRAYAARRQRDDVFAGYSLFGEPGWDILIDLFIAGEERKRISVSSACIGASCPPTTALRWLSTLHQQGLVVRTGDPDDARRVYVALSEDGSRLMHLYFSGRCVRGGDTKVWAGGFLLEAAGRYDLPVK